MVSADKEKIMSVISNLISNAIKYSPKESAITFLLKKQSNGIDLHVTDEGPGIPEEERKKIFERFYRIGNESVRKTKGTGLGLYLCKKIAADHNAVIQVTNNAVSGSTFSIHFKL